MIIVEEEWKELATSLSRRGVNERIYMVGSTSSGKTTLCRYLVNEVIADRSIAHVDCDTGQSVIGPPTAVGMALYSHQPVDLQDQIYLRFVGSTSPGGHLLQMLTGAKRLVEKAIEMETDVIIIDSPGLISGAVGIEFQFQMIDLLRPTRIAALQRGRELEPLLANFAHHPTITIHRIAASSAAVTRTAVERRRYREERFIDYFANAKFGEISLQGIGLQGRVPNLKDPYGVRRRLISINDNDNFTLTLGIAEKVQTRRHRLTVFAQPFDPDAVASIRFGSINLNIDAEPGLMESHVRRGRRKST